MPPFSDNFLVRYTNSQLPPVLAEGSHVDWNSGSPRYHSFPLNLEREEIKNNPLLIVASVIHAST